MSAMNLSPASFMRWGRAMADLAANLCRSAPGKGFRWLQTPRIVSRLRVQSAVDPVTLCKVCDAARAFLHFLVRID